MDFLARLSILVLCYVSTTSTQPPPPPLPTSGQQQICGKDPSKNAKRVVGGSTASENEFPWHAAMSWRLGSSKGDHICGGSLISKKFVLLAAHCFEHGAVEHYYNITLGQHIYSQESGNEQRFHIKRILEQPTYNPMTYDGDLALVELDGEVKFTQNIYPICLPGMMDFELAGKMCVVTGWGNNGTHHSTDQLKKANVPIIANKVCNAPQSYNGKVTWNMFCAGYADGRADSCSGDSGGPFQCFSNNSKRWVINGVVSWGEGCGSKNKYGVYARVRHYLTWINKEIGAGTPPIPSGMPPIPSGGPPIPSGGPPIPPFPSGGPPSPPFPSGMPPLPSGHPPLPSGHPPLPSAVTLPSLAVTHPSLVDNRLYLDPHQSQVASHLHHPFQLHNND
ncbi:serine protease 1-like isoform X2 [Clytia hemisphaerica]|uniref:serine protease 1-like isoform X2 n=1 Tax=Clytia hemisphaerica TaxID=252671 RepID=UPI0034D483C5